MITFVPESKYTNYYDIARYNLTWRLSLILLAFLPVLAIVLFNLGENAAYPSLIGVGLCLLTLLILIKTKSFTLPAILYSVIGAILSQYTLIFFPESYHFVDPAWIMIIVLYAYFTLGKIWGTVVLGFCLTGITYYILEVLNINLEMTKNSGKDDTIALAINFIVCGIIIAFLIFQFLELNSYAESKYITLTDTLKDKNKEKTVLLKEIHHRVKNNLQVVTSLLRLQSRDINEEKYKLMYRDSINRVLSMALIHEKIYQTPDLAKINLKVYLESLAQDLISSYSLETKIDLNIESNLEKLNTKSLVPVALIFNELISNSIKHGFKDQKIGKINIQIIDKYPKVKIRYSDDGRWIEQPEEGSLGLELVQSLTEQLSGSHVRSTENGTHYTFNFVYDD